MDVNDLCRGNALTRSPKDGTWVNIRFIDMKPPVRSVRCPWGCSRTEFELTRAPVQPVEVFVN